MSSHPQSFANTDITNILSNRGCIPNDSVLHAVVVFDDLTGPGDSSEVRRNSPKDKDFLSSPSYKSFYSFTLSCLDLLTIQHLTTLQYHTREQT